jgi:hypothetical protein
LLLFPSFCIFNLINLTTQAAANHNEDLDEDSEFLEESDEADDFPEEPVGTGKFVKFVKDGKVYFAQEVGRIVFSSRSC